jgi:hypothetical protein
VPVAVRVAQHGHAHPSRRHAVGVVYIVAHVEVLEAVVPLEPAVGDQIEVETVRGIDEEPLVDLAAEQRCNGQHAVECEYRIAGIHR